MTPLPEPSRSFAGLPAFPFEPALGHTEFDTAFLGEFEHRAVGFFDRYLLGE
jgi:hypothetical protein